MPRYYAAVSQIKSKAKILVPLSGHLYSQSRPTADIEAMLYRDKLNEGFTLEWAGPEYYVVQAVPFWLAKTLEGFATFSRQRVTPRPEGDIRHLEFAHDRDKREAENFRLT